MYVETSLADGDAELNEVQKSQRLNRINAKGLAVATKLSEVLAGKDIDLSELGDLRGIDPRDTKERRLREYLDTINAARTRLLKGDYGICLECKEPLGDALLDETPWATLCNDCRAGLAG